MHNHCEQGGETKDRGREEGRGREDVDGGGERRVVPVAMDDEDGGDRWQGKVGQ